MKNKKIVLAIVLLTIFILSVVFYMIFAPTAIERQTWELLSASKVGEPFPIVAHKAGLDVSDYKYFMKSKEVELICTAEDGKLTLTDKTNDKVYDGTYKVKRSRWNNIYTRGSQNYICVIDGKECTANVSYNYFNFWNANTFTVNIDGYTLTFVKK